MLRRRSVVLLLALAALAFPAASLAQSAGDDQYQDPLAGSPSGGNNSGNTTQEGSSGSGTAPSTPTTTPSTSGGAEGTAPATTAATPTSGELPRTGFDVLLTIELGLALLLTGLVSQRMLVLRDRRDQRH